MTADLWATIALAAAVLALVATVTHTEPGALIRLVGGEHTGRHVRPAATPRTPHRPPLVRHAAGPLRLTTDTPARAS